MRIYFSSEDYKKRALAEANLEYKNNHSVKEAFFLLINGREAADLDNLCKLIEKYFSIKEPKVDLTLDECYQITQGKSVEGKLQFDENVQAVVYNLAYLCIENGKELGNKTINDGKINTSSWMSHCLFEAKLCGQLAGMMGLDQERAQKLGILHDYGRKFSHTSEHITKGYEELSKLGWEEAIGAISHSFLKGERCSWNDESEEGFHVDEDGFPHWDDSVEKDDIGLWLDEHKQTDYDFILNVADLMATSYGIVSPSERIADIATRRKEFDPRNRLFFIAEFTNALIELSRRIGAQIPKEFEIEVRASKRENADSINEKFQKASDILWAQYQKNIKEIEEPEVIMDIGEIG